MSDLAPSEYRIEMDRWGNRVHIPPAIRLNPRGEDRMPKPSDQKIFCTKADGYRGIWWGQTHTGDEYVYKYSGGLGTYPVQNAPFAVYAAAVNKTFFVWGGASADGYLAADSRAPRWDYGPGELLHMISYYDHDTGTVPRPTILFDKWTADPHDNPVLTIDDDGYIWVFSPSHGNWTTPSFIHRSASPYSIDRFITMSEGLFAYPQVWWSKGLGLSFFFTLYATEENPGADRGLFYRHSPDGISSQEPVCIARCQSGHYQVTAESAGIVATAFDLHPNRGGLEARTNIYYLRSSDFGKTWTTASGTTVQLPVETPRHPALVRDFQAEGLLCYIKDLVLDENGNPHIHFVTSSTWRPGPDSGPHTWQVAAFADGKWTFEPILESDHNYDMGSLQLLPGGARRIIGTSGQGPQKFNTGGEIEVWHQSGTGQPWVRERILTTKSEFNHSHPRRPVNAHPDFGVLWADGHGRRPSPSRLYFSDAKGCNVRVLPSHMRGNAETPIPFSATR